MCCYICQNNKTEKVDGIVRDLPELKILRCINCGLVFLENFDHIKENYYEDSRMFLDEGFTLDSWIQECEPEIDARVDWVKPIVKFKRLLDFGCGGGGLLREIKPYVKRCVGIEVSKDLRDIIKKRYNIDTYKDVSEVKEKFDIITMFHVMEHLKDPKIVIKELSSLLAPNGSIIIETPNIDDALLTFYNCKAFSKFTYWSCHLYLFSQFTLRKLVESIGLKVNYIKQVQRFPLSNHLYWLSQGKWNGHNIWGFMDDKKLNEIYETQLAKLGICDTLLASISKEKE